MKLACPKRNGESNAGTACGKDTRLGLRHGDLLVTRAMLAFSLPLLPLLLISRLFLPPRSEPCPAPLGNGGAALASSPPAGRDPLLSALLGIRNNLSA